jgi:hypothetical protein
VRTPGVPIFVILAGFEAAACGGHVDSRSNSDEVRGQGGATGGAIGAFDADVSSTTTGGATVTGGSAMGRAAIGGSSGVATNATSEATDGGFDASIVQRPITEDAGMLTAWDAAACMPNRHLVAGPESTCVFGPDGTVCWGGIDWTSLPTPTDAFDALALGQDGACGLRADGTIACWGNYAFGETPPAGSFRELAVAYPSVCALRTDSLVQCWPAAFNEPSPNGLPTDKLVHIVGGDSQFCGLTENGDAECWGGTDAVGTWTTSGPFTDIAPTDHVTCCPGIRRKGRFAR